MSIRALLPKPMFIPITCLSLSLFLGPITLPVQAQGVIDVTVGKPSVWTLAQAHYLLAQMHQKDRGFSLVDLIKLDPNGINRQRIDVLQTMLGISGGFDQTVGLKNSLLQQRYQTNYSRQQAVKAELDQRNNQLIQGVHDLYVVQTQLSTLNAASPPDQKAIDAKTAEKNAKQDEQAALNTRNTALNTELTSLQGENITNNVPSFSTPSTGTASSSPITPALANLIDKSFLDSLYKDSKGTSSQLRASEQLDNYIQMQYELISKQLTLLRDEVGKDQRVIFLELPSSLYTVANRADAYLAQVRWDVTQYLVDLGIDKKEPDATTCRNINASSPGTSTAAINASMNATNMSVQTIRQYPIGARLETFGRVDPRHAVSSNNRAKSPPEKVSQFVATAVAENRIDLGWTDDNNSGVNAPTTYLIERSLTGNPSDYRQINEVPASVRTYADCCGLNSGVPYFYQITARNNIGSSESFADSAKTWFWQDVNSHNPEVRTVDVIPRQSALNVNGIHQTNKGFALSAKFLTLFGLGGQVDYQRQKEVYDQFVYQDVFASGFGKGSSRFGWTFGPLPGTKSIAPGVRTTYAVLVVPREARALRIKASGYPLRRDQPEPAWGDTSLANVHQEEFTVDIPTEDTNGFHITGVEYAPVKSGDRVTVVLRGDYFSPQIGVLVRGHSQDRDVALSPIDPASKTSSNTTASGTGSTGVTSGGAIVGEYEYVNSRELVVTFQMPSDYEGTPIITLIAPEKSSDINRLDLSVNNSGWTCDSLQVHSIIEPMFIAPLSLDSIQIVDSEQVRVRLTGKGFRPDADITINGKATNSSVQKSIHEYEITFSKPPEPTWNITMRQTTREGVEERSLRIDKPLAPHIEYEILRYVAGHVQMISRGQRMVRGIVPDTLDLRITVSDFDTINHVWVIKDGVANPLPSEPIFISAAERVITVPVDSTNEPILLQIVSGRGESALINVLPPIAPKITSVVNGSTGKAEGPPEGNYSVLIHGEHLEQVERVLFGDTPGQIQQRSPGVLTVVVPKGSEGTVRVILETNTLFQNRLLSNSEDFNTQNGTTSKAMFTYVKAKPSTE